MMLSYRFRVLATRSQHAALASILETQRQLYNAALEERIGCYRNTGKTRSYIDQCKALTEWRREDPAADQCPLNIHRWTIRRLDEAYKAFFRRVKAGGKPGFPRFRGKGWWKSFGFNEFVGIRFDGRRLRFAGISLRVHQHRTIPDGRILGCVFTRDAKGWNVCLQVRVEAATLRATDRSIGIDVGLIHLATLSTGETIPNPRHAKRVERELRRRQRAMARCERGSNGRRKARRHVERLHNRVANTRLTALHQASASIVNRYDLIVVEKLNVKGLAGSMLAKSVHDASWGQLRELLAYKAEKAGARLIEVNPRYTSQACSGCGVIVKKALSERVHSCPCGTVLDRDHNAALVILHKAVVGLGELNVGRQSERVRGNIGSKKIRREALPQRARK